MARFEDLSLDEIIQKVPNVSTERAKPLGLVDSAWDRYERERVEKECKQEFIENLTKEIKKIRIGSTPSQIMKILRDFKHTISTTINGEGYNLTVDLNSFGNSEFSKLKPIWQELDRVLNIWKKIWIAKLKKQGKDVPAGYEIDPYTGKFYPQIQIAVGISAVHGEETTTPDGVSRLMLEISKTGETGFYINPGIYFNHILNKKAFEAKKRGDPFDFNRVDEAMADSEFRRIKAEMERVIDSFNTEEGVPRIMLDFHNTPSIQESCNNPKVDAENCIERPYMLVSYDPSSLAEGNFLEHPEIRQMIEVAKSLGIPDLKFCPQEPFANTLIGNIEQGRKDTNPVKGIIFEFPQTITQGNMSDKEFKDLQYKERYLSTATMARAMLLFRGLQSDSQESSPSLPLQLQFIAGSIDFPEAIEGVKVEVWEVENSSINTNPKNVFLKYDNKKISEDDEKVYHIRQSTVRRREVLENECLKLGEKLDPKFSLITDQHGIKFLELDNPLEYLEELSKMGYILHGSPYLFKNVEIKPPDKNDSENTGRDMKPLIYGSYTEWFTACFMAFSKRTKDGGGQTNCGIKANVIAKEKDWWETMYDFPISEMELTNPPQEAYVYILDPFYFQRNPDKNDHLLEWTSKNPVKIVPPVVKVKLTTKDLREMQKMVEDGGGKLVVN